MLAAIVGGGLAAFTALLAYSAVNEQNKEVIDHEIDLKWMQASIDAMPKCHYLAYGSVSPAFLHPGFLGCLPRTAFNPATVFDCHVQSLIMPGLPN